MGKLNMNKNKKKKKINKNVIQKSLNLFFYNSTKQNKENEKNENIIPIQKALNINICIPNRREEAKVSLKNSKRKISYKIHKKCNSINENINNKKIRKIKIYDIIPKELKEDKNRFKHEMNKNMKNVLGKENESLSLQSINDSKIMELANKYILDEEKFNKNEIIEILNTKKENSKE